MGKYTCESLLGCTNLACPVHYPARQPDPKDQRIAELEAALQAERERALEDAAKVAEAYWKDGRNVYARHAGRAVETRIRALKGKP